MEVQDNASQNALAATTESAPVTDVTETPAATTESAPVTEATVEQTTEVEGAEPSKTVKELISQRKRRQDAEREAAYWRGVAEGKGHQAEPAVAPRPEQTASPDAMPVLPVLDNFETFEEYEQASRRYTVDLAKYELRQEENQRSTRQQKQTVQQTFWEKVDNHEQQDPAIRDEINHVGRMVSPVVADLVVESEVGIELVKYLAANPKEAQRLSQLHPLMAAKEMGVLEAQVKFKPKAEPPKRISQAPEPIPTITPAGSVAEFDPEKATMEEYYAHRMAERGLKRK